MTAPGNQFEHLHIRAPEYKRGVAVIKSRVTKAPLPFTVMTRTGTETRKRERLLEERLVQDEMAEKGDIRSRREEVLGDTAAPPYQAGDAAK